ncbi:hypothetical protein [Streptomyces sp. NPDC096012]|uniref:hypothetical protein n=1 Tax=Streptomyces sp. NPDC096012 TaxID=3155684 RepID=UPI00336A2E24
MRVQDVTLPGPDAADQWSELLIHTATPEIGRRVGKQWTDTGKIHEERDLKGRPEGETRTVPGHPALTRILRQHIEDGQLQPGDLLVQSATGGILAGSVIRRAWRSARRAVLPEHVFESPTGKRVYDDRHTHLTKRLNDGIPPAQVADWAGNGVPVLPAATPAVSRCSWLISSGGWKPRGTSPDSGTPTDSRPRLAENFGTYATRSPAKTR